MSIDARKAAAGLRFVDILIVTICLSGALLSINQFRIDLNRTISLQNEQPAGYITIRSNIVQRRISNRVLWDRLAVNSPVYPGDLIRVADLSAATLYIDGISINLNENTLIRIQQNPGDKNSFQIEMSLGSISLSSDADAGKITLNLMGMQVEAAPGTVLIASAGNEGMVVQVNEGTALFIEDSGIREVKSGAMISLDSSGTERQEPAAVVMFPRPNARFLRNTQENLSVDFAWSRINLAPDDLLRLEISGERHFSSIAAVLEDLDVTASAALDDGLWYWRLCFNDEVLSSGHISITGAAGPALLSPVTGSLYRFQGELPMLRFQWTEIQDAGAYTIEASQLPDFSVKHINARTDAVFFQDASLEPGLWYWRVMPVFPSVYEGNASYSPISFFRIEQIEAAAVIAGQDEPEKPDVFSVVFPEPEPEPEPEIEPVPEPVPAVLRLLSPAHRQTLPGLTALREQTVFRWDAEGELANWRFILSRNPNLLNAAPDTVLYNPDHTVRLNRLDEGTWYWGIAALATNGLESVSEVRELRVLPIPLLPAPLSPVPSSERRIGIEELRNRRTIAFSWQPVSGANAYIFTLYQRTTGGLRQIITRPPENRTSWTMEDISILDRGTFVWRVEAVNIRNNVIEQRGAVRESTFYIDIPLPGPVRVDDSGILYGR